MKQETTIFKDAYFGKPYKMRSEDKALYSHYDDNYNLHKLFTYSHFVWVDNEGFVDEEHIELNHPDDIVSEWQEPINKEQLEQLAKIIASLNDNEEERLNKIALSKYNRTIEIGHIL